MTKKEISTLYESANSKVEKKEEIKILKESKELKQDKQKEIASLNYQIATKKKELYKVVKANKENTTELFKLLNQYLMADDKFNFKITLENHLIFNNYSIEFYNKLFNSKEKQQLIGKLNNWFNTFSPSGLYEISLNLENYLF